MPEFIASLILKSVLTPVDISVSCSPTETNPSSRISPNRAITGFFSILDSSTSLKESDIILAPFLPPSFANIFLVTFPDTPVNNCPTVASNIPVATALIVLDDTSSSGFSSFKVAAFVEAVDAPIIPNAVVEPPLKKAGIIKGND